MQLVPNSDNQQLVFTCPATSRRVYLTTGPSGWPEAFSRASADADLAKFATPIPIANLIDIFLTGRELSTDREEISWWTITGFLGRTLKMSPINVPPAVGVAFWAQANIVAQERARDRGGN